VPFPSEAVPTSVTVGPDGALYVGLLTGAPFPVGGASVWRLAEGEEPTEYATGFTNIMGLGFGPDGTLYAAEMVQGGLMSVFAGEDVPPFGAVVSVGPDGGEPQVVASGEQLMALGGLAVDAEGAIYVSTGTIMGPGGGALVKIVP
jgi:sugar lactone lactonase YvrE